MTHFYTKAEVDTLAEAEVSMPSRADDSFLRYHLMGSHFITVDVSMPSRADDSFLRDPS